MNRARTEYRRSRVHAFAGFVLAGALLLIVGMADPLRSQPTGSQVRGQDACGCDEDAVAEYNRQLEAWMNRQIERVRAASFPSPAPAADPSGVAPVVSGEMEAQIREGVSNLDTTLRDPRGTTMTGSTVAGLVMIRDIYVDKLRELADRFEALAEAGMADQRDRVRELIPKARELERLRFEIRNLNVMIPDRPIRGPEDHAEWNRERMRKQDEARTRFNEVLGSCPELSIPHDGQDLWQALNDVPSSGRSSLEVELDQRRVLEEYLRSGAKQLRELADEAEQKDAIEELMEFGGPMYEEIREAVAIQGDLVGSELPRDIMEQVELIVRAYEIHTGVDEGWWRVGLATVAVLAIPISPVLCLGVAAVDVTVTGGELVVTYLDAEEARAARPATGAAGQRYMVTAEDRRNAAAGDFVLAVVGLGLDASAVRAVKVRGLEPRPCPDPEPPRVVTGGEEVRDSGRVVTGSGNPPDAPPTGRAPGTADDVPSRQVTGGTAPVDRPRTGDATRTGDDVEAGPRIERVETVSDGKRWGHLGDATVDEAFGHPDIPDDAWVHFGGSEIAEGVRTEGVRGYGDRSYWARWGEVKNMTQGELRWKIGESTVSGQSDLRTLVVAPEDARIRTVPGNYGFEVEGVADGSVDAGRVLVAPSDAPPRSVTDGASGTEKAANARPRTNDARDAARAGVRTEEIRRAGQEEEREETGRVERADPPAGDARPETVGEAEDDEAGDGVRRVSDARTGDPGAAGPTGGGGGGTAVAMTSVPGEVVESVEPIEFEIWPRDPVDRPSTSIDSATLVNTATPDPIRTGIRDPTVQLVILDGPETLAVPPTDGSAQAQERRVPGGAVLFDPDLLLHVVSEGGLGADAMRIVGFNGRDLPVSFDGGSLVVEPVDVEEEVRERIEKKIRDLARGHPWTTTLHAYCVEFLREPPTPGSVFRIASQDLQQRFAPLGDVLRAGRELHARGLLNPDSDPAEYFHSIRQWAVWTSEERLDRAGFERGFVEHVRRNFTEAGQPWTEEAETLVRGLVPNRWDDVRKILDAVRSPERTEDR